MKHSEIYEQTQQYKKEYVDSFELIIKKRQEQAEKEREMYISGVFENQEKYRDNFKRMLGWPLVDYEETGLPEVTMMEKLSEEETHTVYRMQFKIIGELKITGLFFKSKSEGKKPLVIAQHGGMGTPEAISGFYETTSHYNEMLERIIKYDVHAFAPQLLLWAERYGVEYDRKATDARLKRLGGSITAVEIFAIRRILDYFETKEYVKNFGMIGLSYGGFYTLYTAAIDTRIKSAISCSFFNKRDEIPWIDWTWNNSGFTFDDAEIACLVYPRTLCIELGDKDNFFDYRYGVESFEKLKEYCKEVGIDWVKFILFDGVHEFHKDDEPIENLVKELK